MNGEFRRVVFFTDWLVGWLGSLGLNSLVPEVSLFLYTMEYTTLSIHSLRSNINIISYNIP